MKICGKSLFTMMLGCSLLHSVFASNVLSKEARNPSEELCSTREEFNTSLDFMASKMDEYVSLSEELNNLVRIQYQEVRDMETIMEALLKLEHLMRDGVEEFKMKVKSLNLNQQKIREIADSLTQTKTDVYTIKEYMNMLTEALTQEKDQNLPLNN